MIRKLVFLLFLLIFSVLMVGCGAADNENEEVVNTSAEESITDKDIVSGSSESDDNTSVDDELLEEEAIITVFTTIYFIEEFTNRIGGNLVEVTNIVPPGADAHSFEPTASQMINIANSDLFIINGLGFEGFVERIKEVIETENVKIVTASDGIEVIRGKDDHNDDHDDDKDDDHKDENDKHGNEDEDPHIWLDPLRAIKVAQNIKLALIDLVPEKEDTITVNFEALKGELETLDQEFLAIKDVITKDTFVVSHAAYGYWEERYEIHQKGIAGISPTNEPSIKQIQDTIQFIQENDINYIVFEQNIPTKIAETVREQVGAESVWLHNLESVTQEEISAGEDYFSLMRRNIETLKTALK